MAANKTLTRTLTLIFACSLALIILPQASAIQANCTIAPKGTYTPADGVRPIADVSQPFGGHLADEGTSSFGYNIYCNSTFTQWDQGGDILSYSDSGGANQGHVSDYDNPSFAQKIQGNWSQCALQTSSLCTTQVRACVVGVTDSGTVSGYPQGHAATCGSAPYEICCCPSDSAWNPGAGRCEEFSDDVLISNLVGETSPIVTGTYDYNFTAEWGWRTPLRWDFDSDNVTASQDSPESYGAAFGSSASPQTVTRSFSFPEEGDYEICAYGELQGDANTNDSMCMTVTTTCVSGAAGGNPAPSSSACCSSATAVETPPGSDNWACYNTANVNGTVVVMRADGPVSYPEPVANAVVTIESTTTSFTRNTTTVSGGYYEMTGLPGDDYIISVNYLDRYFNTTAPSSIDMTAGGWFTQDFTLTEQPYNSDCINLATGRCDRDALGNNGCLTNTSDPDYENMRDTLYACDPVGSRGRQPGTLVFTGQNETHRRSALCCKEPGEWRPAPRAEIEGDVENLITYTRLTTYLGQPVRLVIATWN